MHQEQAALVHPRLPYDPRIRSWLASRGLALEPDPDEDAPTSEARIETALMALFRDRREEYAFQALYEFTRDNLLAWVTSLLSTRRSSTDPLEVLQDTYVSIYRYSSSFRDEQPRSFRVWSRTIAGNLLKRPRPGARLSSLQALPEGLQEPVDRRGGPGDVLSLAEERETLRRAWMIILGQYVLAWEKLPERDRVALDLIEVQGLSYAEASVRLRVGLSNMKMILFRARKKIRASIELAILRRPTRIRRIAV
jgi:RNA polymerase sigma factor (sigma-70 family)